MLYLPSVTQAMGMVTSHSRKFVVVCKRDMSNARSFFSCDMAFVNHAGGGAIKLGDHKPGDG